MIQPRSIVKIADNTGGKIGRIFKVLGGSKRHYAQLGDIVVLSVQKAEPRKGVKKKDVLKAVVVRQKNQYRRKDGSYIRFDENAVVIVNKAKKEWVMVGNRVFGPIPREITEKGMQSISSLAPEVVYTIMHVKKNDPVKILAGKDKGKTGKILKAFPAKDMVLVDGVNVHKKHQRSRRGNEKGQVVDRPMPIHVSNVRKAE